MNNGVENIDIPDWAQFQASLSPQQVWFDCFDSLRYKSKPIIGWLSDHIDLDEMWTAYRDGKFSRDEFMQFYRDIGYSLGGFAEVWGDDLEKMEAEEGDVERGKR